MRKTSTNPKTETTEFWLLQSGQQGIDYQLERQARAVWSTLAEPTDPIARLLWLSLGAINSLQAVYEKDLPALTRGLEAAVEHEQSTQIAVTAARQPQAFKNPAELINKSLTAWHKRINRNTRFIQERSFDLEVHCIMPADPQWPKLLSDLQINTPLALWVKGSPQNLSLAAQNLAISMVGARASTAYGNQIAEELALALAERGITVASGGAFGIDAATHKGALAANFPTELSVPTVAFLAGGLDAYYPKSNTDLQRQIEKYGALYSEAPIGASPSRWRFLSRNRLLAAYGSATLVVEAAWRSGALSTASHADVLSRPVGAIPGSIFSPVSAGTHRLIAERGAALITSVEEIIDLLPASSLQQMKSDKTALAQAVPATLASSVQLDLELLSAQDRLVFDAIPPLSSITMHELANEAGIVPAAAAVAIQRIQALDLIEINRGKIQRKQSSSQQQ